MEQLSTNTSRLVAQETPLSSGQMRLWFLDQLDPVDSPYNSLHQIEFRCRIDPDTLRTAIGRIVERHDVLRTHFQVAGDSVVQVIGPLGEVELPVLHLHDVPPADRAGRVKAAIAELCRQPFDLRQLPLFRTVLVRLDPDTDLLLVQLHHIIADGLSSLVLLEELSAIYQAASQGMPSSEALPPLRAQYADYALWEQQWLTSQASAKELAYWREQLKDPPPPLELSANEPDADGPNAGVVSFELPGPMVRELRRLARQEKVTPFMCLLAALQCLLYRYTGAPDIIVGSPVAGRSRPEFEHLIGFFVNTLALRTRIRGDETFRDLLTRVRATCLRAYGNQTFPFERIVEELHPDRHVDSTPLFQVMLSLNRVSATPADGTTWSFRSLATEDQRPQFDLLLAFFESESDISGTLTYRSSMFRRAAMERLVGHLQELVRQVCATADVSVDAVQILTTRERRRLLHDLNATASIDPAGQCLHELFEEQALRTPQATALVSGERRMDYREVDQRADRLARCLRRLGVGPEVRVGICMKRSPDIVVSILAVLKAGGAYVPLDPAYPPERLAFMAADSELKVLIAGGTIPDSLSDQVGRNGSAVVAIDDESTWDVEPLPPSPATLTAVPSNLAYVIYTSGSTGVPKGVCIEHRNVVNFIRWALSVFSAEDLARTVASTSVCFDLSIFEIFAPLGCGGEVVLVENALQLGAESGERQVSLLNTVPSVVQELLYTGSLPSLHTLNLAGEPFTGTLLRMIREANVATRVFNLYGPSETTTYSSFACAGDDDRRAVPIGRPVRNTQCYVFDRLMEPVPIGVAGELYIGGQGVARGYLKRPALTAERFVPDPFAAEAGQRLYKTGDLVRYREDEELEFVGRIDHQVKIRGFRIEPGEIEAALREHASVREAVVVARQEGDGDKRLIAYVVPQQQREAVSLTNADDGPDADTETLRRYLTGRLPSHMIPGRLVFLERLPLTPNGKVDRDRLPDPEIASGSSTRLHVAPRTSTERIIADIWSELLAGQPISVDRSFFELGGHSLLAARAVLRMREAFGVEIPLRVIFEHPDVAGLAQHLSAGQPGEFQSVPLVRQAREVRADGEFAGCHVFPASPGQQRLWFLQELNEASGAAYHVCGGLRLEGAVAPEQMAAALHRVGARHESLRTRLALVGGELHQIIAPEQRLAMAYDDVRGAGGAQRLQAITAADAEQPFDLRAGPLVRAHLVRVDEAGYQLLLTAHHSICDGWSVTVFIADLLEAYRGLVEGDGGRLAALPIQYADFAVWQREWLASPAAASELAYWTDTLGGPAPVLPLPLDGARPAIQTFRGGTETRALAPAVGDRLRTLARAAGATRYMTLLSAFMVLLHKYSGQRDIWVGTPVANRHRRELDGAVGFFVNTLVMRTALGPELTFREVLARVRTTVAGGYGHQQLPFERLVEALHPQRHLSTTPLFQVMFAVDDDIAPTTGPCGLTIAPVRVETGTAKFDLTLTLADGAEGLVARLDYNRDLFTAATMRRMLGHLDGVLQAMGRDPERRLADVSLLTDDERRQIAAWNATDAACPQRCLHELVETRAAQAPEAIAVAHGTREWSYGELNRRANQLAHHLRHKGVGPEVRVGICMRRSLDMIAALLGVLKAGGAYVPLDASYPRERLEWMLEDAQVAVLLGDESLQQQLSGSGTPAISLEQEREQIERQSDENPIALTDIRNLAYVIYTSGSTGRPKGVAITHHSANVMVHWARGVFTDEELAGVLASTSICFDLSIFEIFVPLSWGGRVVLAGTALDLTGMGGAEQIRLINTVPSAMAELLRMKAVPSSVRTVNLAGEALPRSLVEEVYALGHVERVFNLYGPSEDTTYSTAECVKPGAPGDAVAIGRPIANTRAYVLDAALEPVPVGVTGELCLGGEGQARGYLNRPDLTADRFVPDPHGTRGGERMYRTGDLARWTTEGTLEFLGRLDHQVKIRGYRIEMGEIESRLLEQVGVTQAVVTVHGSGAEPRLVAYVVARDGGAELDLGALRDDLRTRIPAYMVPDVIVQLAELPLTSNGKVDRRKLPEPARDRDRGAGYLGPRNAEEEILCGIFAEVLKLARVGIDDDFFQMGGHSLLATQVVSRIRTAFGVRVPLSHVFEAPTAAGIAERITAARGMTRNEAPPLVAAKRDGPVPLSYGQQRLWFIDQLAPGNPAYNIAFGLRLEGALDREGLRWSVNEIVRRHESLRTRFPLRDGSPVQEIAAPGPVAMEDVNLEGQPEEERQSRVLAEARAEAVLPFDLGRGPLLRVKLLRAGEQDHVLLVTLHHIVGDGWSVGVMMREFMELYRAWLKKEESPLPALKVQYADYAAWQREWPRGEMLERELAHWRERLADVPALEFPVDHPRPAVMSHRGGTMKVELSAELTDSLKQLSRRQGVTLFMTVLAAVQMLLGRYAGQDDVTVGTGIANRNQPETEGVIGFFVNTLVLRTRLGGNPTFLELLKRVRQVTLEAYEHQDVPFEKLVDRIQPSRDLSRTPLFQAMLMFQNLSMPELELPGLRVSEFNVDSGAAKFDLMLTLQESGGTLNGELSYARDLYEAATMERLVVHLAGVLKAMVERPDARIGDVSLLTSVERRQIVEEWNATTREYPQGCQLQELIEQQVERSPDALAVTCDGRELTYRELNERANQLGHDLRERGVGPDVRVGICAERSLEMVVGLLGILKAGGAYVPLDPDYPADRLQHMVDDSRPALLLTQERTQARLAGLASVPAFCLDRDWPALANRPATNLPRSGSADDLAYVIYTSGSTGQPKGAMIPHRGIVNRLIWMQEQYRLTGADRVLQKTPFSFDVSVWEFFWPLLAGAGLVVCQPGRHGDSRYLVELIEKARVTTLHFVPSMLSQFLEDAEVERCASVRRVICSGEALPVAVQERFFTRMHAELHNLYGPTEASVDVTYWACLRGTGDRAVPIGRPIANTQIYVLDEQLNPVPVGVTGNLFIGGAGLARGYQNRPGLTAEKFIPDGFSAQAGQRLYTTGDLARFRADGSVEFLGRSDFQVKVRGFRIEPGEIEGALQSHDGIHEAVVVARAGAEGDHRLIAYVVASGETAPGVDELRDHLHERLPAHMVPSQFVMLPRMPLSRNGKVDRKALPEPGTERPEIDEPYVEASSAGEHVLAAVWRQVLGVERIGVHDNFFTLGGDSIRSLQVIARARAEGLQITLQQLFQTPTIHGLAAHAQWSAHPAAEAEPHRPFGLISDDDRAKLRAVLTRTREPEPVQLTAS